MKKFKFCVVVSYASLQLKRFLVNSKFKYQVWLTLLSFAQAGCMVQPGLLPMAIAPIFFRFSPKLHNYDLFSPIKDIGSKQANFSFSKLDYVQTIKLLSRSKF